MPIQPESPGRLQKLDTHGATHLASDASLDLRDLIGAATDASRTTHVSPVARAAAAARPPVTVAYSGDDHKRTLPAVAEAVGGERRYQTVRVLGRGGMGEVRLVTDPALRREVALKVVCHRKPPPHLVARFVQEAQVTGQLEHPNIVPVYEAGITDEGLPYFTMKAIRGRSLAQRLAEMKALVQRRGATARNLAGALSAAFPLAERIDVLKKVCEALAYAHSRGVVHRDLKPDNVMIGAFGEVLVLDWGIARLSSNAADAESTGPTGPADSGDSWNPDQPVSSDRSVLGNFATMNGMVAGTPAYMSPEQALGDVAQIDARTDVFAIGAMLYEMLTLSAPWEAETVDASLQRARSGRAEPTVRRALRLWKGRVPTPHRSLAAIADKAIMRDPDDRYASVLDLHADLAAWQVHEPVSARRGGWAERAARTFRRHPVTVVSATLILFAVLAVVALLAQLSAMDADRARLAASADAERERADAERQRTLLARASAAAARGELDEVKDLLQASANVKRNAMVEQFQAEWDDAMRAGMNEDRFIQRIDRSRLADWERAYDALAASDYTMTAQDWVWRAWLRRAQGNLAGAVADCTAALAVDPRYFRAANLRAVAHLQLKHFDDALADCQLAAALDPRAVAPLVTAANVWRARGDNERALEQLDRALQIEPTSVAVHYNRGNILRDQNRRDEAMAAFDAVLRLQPTFLEALINRGSLLVAAGKHEQALEDYEQATRADPASGIAWYNVGTTRHRLLRFDVAIEAYSRALAIEPDYVDSWGGRAICRTRIGDTTGAESDWSEYLKRRADQPVPWFQRGTLRAALGRHAEAVEDCTQAITLRPGFVEALIQRGVSLSELGNDDAAIADYDAAITINPQTWQAWANRGSCRLRLGQGDAAIADLQAAWKLCADPADRNMIGQALKAAGGEPPK